MSERPGQHDVHMRGLPPVGDGHPCVVVAELGQNHSGNLATAIHMLREAKRAGANLAKFQKRVPRLCVPPDQWNVVRDTPWGVMSYITYRERLELSEADYEAIDQECRLLGLPWFASAWDESSVEFLMRYGIPALKVASAGVTDTPLLRMIATTGKPVVMSTGGSTLEQIDRAVEILGTDRLVLLHCRSTYPAQVEELNLRAIDTLLDRYGVPVGFSDHAPGLWMSLCAVARGAAMIERHVTVDRSSFGSDQAASVEFHGLARLIKQIRNYERALGDGVVRPYPGEEAIMRRLRRRHA